MKTLFVLLGFALTQASANECQFNLDSEKLNSLAHALSEETLRETWNASIDLYDSSYAEGEAKIVREIAKMSVKEIKKGQAFTELDPYRDSSAVLRFLKTLNEKKVLKRSQETKNKTTTYFYARDEKSDVRQRVHGFYGEIVRQAKGELKNFKWDQTVTLMDKIEGQQQRWDELMEKFEVPVGKIEAYEYEQILLALLKKPEQDLPNKGEQGWRDLHKTRELKLIKRQIETLIEADLVKTKRKKIEGKDGQRITLKESFQQALEEYFFGKESPANYAAKL